MNVKVSGEYAMIYHAAKAGSFSLEDGVRETLTSFRRAGADCVITYFAPQILDWLAEGKLDVEDAKVEIDSMPGVYRYGVNRIVPELKPLVDKGLKSVLLFGVITGLSKDAIGISADSQNNPVVQAVPLLRSAFPDLIIACDVCLCAYTTHGHCEILRDDGSINNELSIQRIAEVAVSYAKAGCHVVAPSDMMDGRVLAIKNGLRKVHLDSTVSLLSYSIKYASAFYGPFRDAAKSCPAFGDRKAYQLPIGSAGLAARAAVSKCNHFSKIHITSVI
ncbi:Endoplasmic reticulum chaperone BiP [Homalodisca vitripennis]|nr:Endoplasmic reticulum chaperone BiP [Homalodisca vitripennis]